LWDGGVSTVRLFCTAKTPGTVLRRKDVYKRQIQQNSAEVVNVRQFQGIYLSPQQTKALSNLLLQNVQQYEATFGAINLQAQELSLIHI